MAYQTPLVGKGMRQCASETSLYRLATLEEAKMAKHRYERALSATKRQAKIIEETIKEEKAPRAIPTSLGLAALSVLVLIVSKAFYDQSAYGLDDEHYAVCEMDFQAIPNLDYARFNGTWNKVAWLPQGAHKEQTCSLHVTTRAPKDKSAQLPPQPPPTGDAGASIRRAFLKPVGLAEHGYHFKLAATKTPVWVIDTDYANWAMLYSCYKNLDSAYHQAYIVSREQTLDITLIGSILSKWEDAGLKNQDFVIKQAPGQCL